MNEPALVWLASYPKSGSTWTRVLLSNIASPDSRSDINRLNNAGEIASSRTLFEHHVGISAGELPPETVDRLRPLLYRHIAANPGDGAMPSIHKIHDGFFRTDGGRFLPDAGDGCRAIYLVRDPRDVAVSFANHCACDIDTAIEMMGDENGAFGASTRRQPTQLRQKLGGWRRHVRSWTTDAAERMPVLVIRYEDLLRNTRRQLATILAFLDIAADATKIGDAVDNASFDKLVAQEQENGFRERNQRSDRFFSRGSAGYWCETLSAEQTRRIERDHGDVMIECGYPLSDLSGDLHPTLCAKGTR